MLFNVVSPNEVTTSNSRATSNYPPFSRQQAEPKTTSRHDQAFYVAEATPATLQATARYVNQVYRPPPSSSSITTAPDPAGLNMLTIFKQRRRRPKPKTTEHEPQGVLLPPLERPRDATSLLPRPNDGRGDRRVPPRARRMTSTAARAREIPAHLEVAYKRTAGPLAWLPGFLEEGMLMRTDGKGAVSASSFCNASGG